jgi:hypothetical protein
MNSTYLTLQLLKRPKKDSVLCKHKKWLLDLQKTKERLEIQYLEEIRKKEEAQSKVNLFKKFSYFALE